MPQRFANHEHPFQKHSETQPKPAYYLLYWSFQKTKKNGPSSTQKSENDEQLMLDASLVKDSEINSS